MTGAPELTVGRRRWGGGVVALALALSLLPPPAAMAGSGPGLGEVAAGVGSVLPPGQRLVIAEHHRLGRFKMGLLRGLVRLVGDEDDADLEVLQRLDRVELASYRVVPGGGPGLTSYPETLARRLESGGWAPVANERDGGELSWVLVRTDPAGGIRALLVIELDDDELELVRVEGEIDQMLAQELAGDPERVWEAAAGDH